MDLMLALYEFQFSSGKVLTWLFYGNILAAKNHFAIFENERAQFSPFTAHYLVIAL